MMIGSAVSVRYEGKDMRTSELSGADLDWAVAWCEGNLPEGFSFDPLRHNYSTNWAKGGPIIEREEMSISRDFESGRIEWAAWTPAPIRDDAEAFGYGPTPLIAAMRCFVACRLGDEVTIPDEIKMSR